MYVYMYIHVIYIYIYMYTHTAMCVYIYIYMLLLCFTYIYREREITVYLHVCMHVTCTRPPSQRSCCPAIISKLLFERNKNGFQKYRFKTISSKL